MSTTPNRKRFAKAVAGLAVAIGAPVLLFVGAGTAQAYPQVSTTNTGYYGVNVTIGDDGNGFERGGDCTYTAVPVAGSTDPGNLPPLPIYSVPFRMNVGGSQTLWFPGTSTGTDWNVTINCTEGGMAYDYVTW